jgi:hypothetical protein
MKLEGHHEIISRILFTEEKQDWCLLQSYIMHESYSCHNIKVGSLSISKRASTRINWTKHLFHIGPAIFCSI